MTQEILYDVRDSIAWGTINRPETRNAMSKAVREGIREEAQVLVITAADDEASSAGGDLKEMADVKMRIPPRDLFVYFNHSLSTDNPIIAAVNDMAYDVGFVNKFVPVSSLLEEAEKLARSTADNAQLSVRAGRRLIYASARLGYHDTFEEGRRLYEAAYLSEDGLEVPRAFKGKAHAGGERTLRPKS